MVELHGYAETNSIKSLLLCMRGMASYGDHPLVVGDDEGDGERQRQRPSLSTLQYNAKHHAATVSV